MPSALLNANQARHLSAVLGLLLDDLSDLGKSLPREPWAEALHHGIDQAESGTRRLLEHLGLRTPERARPRQRLLAYTGVWLARLYDLRPERLSGYGAVSTQLAAQLNPDLTAVSRALEDLARRAAEITEP